jgi:hypothetical protein
MAVKTVVRGNTVSVTSDKFELMTGLMYDASRAQSIAKGGKYHAFSSDSAMKDYGNAETAQSFNGRLALANVVFGFKLWHEGCEEVNKFMETQTHDRSKTYKAIVPGSDFRDEGVEDEEVA